VTLEAVNVKVSCILNRLQHIAGKFA